ncbi:hypothetical protein CTAYLR_002942 [Chrysophaeum taylorii]|uniref:Ubiquitin-like 1-activating enzyme E1A n=1 Tax=Chrysophaeum taylorii TaxID=2483200 RepID=A0AAD7XTN6_9STRA|nr:hypothetical protein CTAYLR_002942 [Chrysophaeum taylorii]
MNDENLVYDRQIRLWGAEAQTKIGATRALLCGIRGVNVEVCKNLVLAGVAVTLVDDAIMSNADLGTNFLAGADGVGENRAVATASGARQLGAFARVEAVAGGWEPRLVAGHDVVVLEGGDEAVVLEANNACRAQGVSFYHTRADAAGGLVFVDLGPTFEYRTEIGTGATARLSEPKSQRYCRFDDLPPVAELTRTPTSVIAASSHQLSYISAIMGGLLAQDVIKTIARKGQPICNFLVFDASTNAAVVHALLPAAENQ